MRLFCGNNQLFCGCEQKCQLCQAMRFAPVLIAAAILVTVLSSCSSKRIMRDCKPLAENYYECEKP